MGTLTQPMPRPQTVQEAGQLFEQGRLVDLGGRPLRLRPCPWCPYESLGETCPRSLPCPTCRAKAGSPCRRGSGHNTWPPFHAPRLAAAAAVDDRRQEAGDPQLPAPWPDLPLPGQLALDCDDPPRGT